ncbi:outer membrane lipoprotein-sorting protein [Granulicella sp. S156]|jgi:outer membrane lipoprotein-sorting protein|uniref:LolA family protein n=1 Tax=Granulicella sp. S156 TaxID=1747224 RepID=UPI00131E62A7|nr:outer membrane lipoprotein-sorting protein [Granulicella sp. S156]
MKVLRSFASVALAVGLSMPLIHAQESQLSTVLSQLDAASQRFKSARADFKWDYYERVVRDTTTQTGPIYFERNGTAIQMGAVVADPTTKKTQRVIEYKGGVLQMFDPGVDQITVLHAGNNQAQYESFLTLGFGGSGKDLARIWNITDQGTESITDNGQSIKVEKLDLVAKDPSVKNTFTHVTIWVDPTRGVPLKQVFNTPSGDYRTATYSNIKLNGSIDKGSFKMHTDSHTTTVNH